MAVGLLFLPFAAATAEALQKPSLYFAEDTRVSVGTVVLVAVVIIG